MQRDEENYNEEGSSIITEVPFEDGEYLIEPHVKNFIDDFNMSVEEVLSDTQESEKNEKITNLKYQINSKIISLTNEMEELKSDAYNKSEYMEMDSLDMIMDDGLIKQFQSNLNGLYEARQSFEDKLK